jgi:hypothetical protein
MANLIDWLAGKKSVGYSEGEGLNLAVQIVEEFDGRTFKFRGPRMRYSGILTEEIVRFLRGELPEYYNYYVSVKTYLNRQNIPQAEIEITGIIGLRGKSSRYNPLDIKFFIKTEI